MARYAAYLHSFSTLCIKQYNCHCAATFDSPLRLNLSNLLLLQIFPKIDSIMCIRRLYNSLPSSPSINFRLMECLSLKRVFGENRDKEKRGQVNFSIIKTIKPSSSIAKFRSSFFCLRI